jgi:hypothetical protein
MLFNISIFICFNFFSTIVDSCAIRWKINQKGRFFFLASTSVSESSSAIAKCRPKEVAAIIAKK